MKRILEFLAGKPRQHIKIFESVGAPMPNFQIVATNVRAGQAPQNYIFDDGDKLEAIVEKWQFKPGGAVGRCGYDYQLVLTNGDLSLPVSICFLCKILIVNHLHVYKISKKHILGLLEEDFRPL